MQNRKNNRPAPTQTEQLQATIESLNNENKILLNKYNSLGQTYCTLLESIISNKITAGVLVGSLTEYYSSN